MEPGYGSDEDVPPLYCEALVHRPKQCLFILEILISSGEGLTLTLTSITITITTTITTTTTNVNVACFKNGCPYQKKI